MPIHLTELLPAFAAFSLVIVLTPLVRTFARRSGAVAQPRPDRWHRRPTALLGGIAIFASAMLPLLFFPATTSVGWLMGCALMFVAGLIDDLRGMRALPKFLLQVLAAVAVLVDARRVALTGVEWLDVCVTILWLVGITNAMNLIDNMDGLAAGLGAIASAFFALWFALEHNANGVLLFSVLAGSLIGFLFYNFNPATIFMGDCGSQFVGFYLASAVLQAGFSDGQTLRDFVVPVLIMAVPIFDTSLVTITRRLTGRRISQGGRDHTSHRLVKVGLSERAAVVALYAAGSCAGMLALAAQHLSSLVAVSIFSVFLALALIFGAKLVRATRLSRNKHST